MHKFGVPLSGKFLGTLLTLPFLTSACGGGEPPLAAGTPPGVPVKLETVVPSTIKESSEFVGSLEAKQRVDLRAETEGRITRIFANSGDKVTADTPIMELRLERSRAQLNAEIANVNVARAARDNAKAELKEAKAEKLSAQAEVELQNEDFERISMLVSQGALPEQRLDQVRRDRNRAVAELEASQERIEADRASLDEANATLVQAQANVEVATEDLQDNKIVAPIAGIVGDIELKVGDYVDIGDTITTITQNQSLDLRLSIPLEKAEQLRVGLPVELVSYQKDEVIVTGGISFISPQVDQQVQGILIKASFPNPGGKLRDEQLVRARVIWEERPGVLIPTAAISRLGGQNFVYVAATPEASEQEQSQAGEAQQIAQQKPVKLGAIQGNKYQVLEGVEPGEKIVVSGILNLSDGTPILSESSSSSPVR
ncbi:MAG: efflux RND transporter periplasmic adaptor subunit [Symploca sp. SIO3C6]|uniref:Efflux RND transporter periplasmic adaptor subunit n=1 Tax=Symploca sp. SIO1C4 TaxID=2607765 RepID=A0A6B3NFF2_9CYAN|nr:efflux RND transporter periplasmic adaptor subunit [Symploca sp. SIO3C6]NER31849.1 efflux RND transporter periplasmic adaptor subunit [Symploca sp. SIO1C4]NET07296.1 efflux RND transporter periplasmic adaptor subunit [Symploca sp. SIO2B6]